MTPAGFLAIAILFEIIATNALKLSEGFTKPLPSVFVILGYGVAFFMLSQALRGIPLGVAYAIWSGVGTVGTALIGIWVWNQPISPQGWVGIALIVLGVIVLNMSGSSH
jgi:multidrug transporter EmrE-like cation transporter